VPEVLRLLEAANLGSRLGNGTLTKKVTGYNLVASKPLVAAKVKAKHDYCPGVSSMTSMILVKVVFATSLTSPTVSAFGASNRHKHRDSPGI